MVRSSRIFQGGLLPYGVDRQTRKLSANDKRETAYSAKISCPASAATNRKGELTTPNFDSCMIMDCRSKSKSKWFIQYCSTESLMLDYSNIKMKFTKHNSGRQKLTKFTLLIERRTAGDKRFVNLVCFCLVIRTRN